MHPLFPASPSALVMHVLAVDDPDKAAVLHWRKGAEGLPLSRRDCLLLLESNMLGCRADPHRIRAEQGLEVRLGLDPTRSSDLWRRTSVS